MLPMDFDVLEGFTNNDQPTMSLSQVWGVIRIETLNNDDSDKPSDNIFPWT